VQGCITAPPGAGTVGAVIGGLLPLGLVGLLPLLAVCGSDAGVVVALARQILELSFEVLDCATQGGDVDAQPPGDYNESVGIQEPQCTRHTSTPVPW